MTDLSKKIEELLLEYFSKLRIEADNDWTDAYKKAENFYCRLLNKIYGWQLYNRNYYKRNESDIDLSSIDKQITVQVTAQKTGKKTKILRTISGFKKRKIPRGYKSIYFAFFEELSDDIETEYNDLNDSEIGFNVIQNIITPNSLKAEIQRTFTLQAQQEILNFLEQELHPVEKEIKSLTNIKSINDSFNRLDDFHSNEKFYNNNWLVLTKPEFELSKRLKADLKNNLYTGFRKYLLLGSSCSGKTTFAYFTGKQLEKYSIIKSFYLKVTSTSRLSDFKNELSILNNNFSFLIVDDIQNNLDFSHELFIELEKYNQIQSLFLSRITSRINEEFEGQIYHRDFVWKNKYTNEIFCDKGRILKLITNRLNYLHKYESDTNYEIGEIEKIFELVNYNLLKLSILLHFWGKEGGILSEINNEKLNEKFFNSYDFKNMDEIELTLRYSSVYSFNIPFQSQLSHKDANSLEIFDRLERKGLFIKENSYYIFHHTAFAELLTQAIIGQFPELKKQGLQEVKKLQLIEYLSSISVLPENFGSILQNLIENNGHSIINAIFSHSQILTPIIDYFKICEELPYNFNVIIEILHNQGNKKVFENLIHNKEIAKKIINFYSIQSYKVISQFIQFNTLFELPVDEFQKTEFLDNLNHSIQFHKIRLYEQDGFKLKNSILSFIENSKININNYSIGLNATDNQVIDFVKNSPINELTLKIYQDSKNLKLTNERLSVIDFSFWMEKFYNSPFMLIGNCLSELKKTPQARQMAYDIFHNLSLELLFSMALEDKNYPVKVSKSLNELTNFKSYDNNRKIIKLIDKLWLDPDFQNKVKKLKLSDFARFLSDISSFNKMLAEQILNEKTFKEYSNLLNNNFEGLYTTTQIINNINSVSSIISTAILTELIKSDFLEKENINSDLNGLHEFKRCLKSYNLMLEDDSKSKFESNTINALMVENDLTKIAKSLVELKANKIIVKKIFESNKLSIQNFKKVAKNEGFRITHLQQILPKLKDADLDLGHKIYISLPDDYFIEPSNRTYFQGICHALSFFNKIDIHYSRKHKSNSEKTKSIYKTLCTDSESSFLRKARNSEIEIFLNGYQQLWNIDSTLTKLYLEPILIQRSKNGVLRNTNISGFGQGIKRLIDLDKQTYYKIGQNLFKLHFPILKQTTKILDIRKISYGLEQISILETEVDQFVNEISDILLEKCNKENTRDDFEQGVLPELEKALKGTKGKLIIRKIKQKMP